MWGDVALAARFCRDTCDPTMQLSTRVCLVCEEVRMEWMCLLFPSLISFPQDHSLSSQELKASLGLTCGAQGATGNAKLLKAFPLGVLGYEIFEPVFFLGQVQVLLTGLMEPRQSP